MMRSIRSRILGALLILLTVALSVMSWRSYADARVDHCPHMETKTFCSACKTHCYKPQMREAIRQVMRWSGPRMIFHHPVLAIRHLIETKKQKK